MLIQTLFQVIGMTNVITFVSTFQYVDPKTHYWFLAFVPSANSGSAVHGSPSSPRTAIVSLPFTLSLSKGNLPYPKISIISFLNCRKTLSLLESATSKQIENVSLLFSNGSPYIFTGIPLSLRYLLASGIEISPKWKIEAAKTADALPIVTAS